MKHAAIALSLMILVPAYACAWQNDIEVRAELFTDSDDSESFTFDQVFHWKDDTTKLGLGATETFIREPGEGGSYSGGLLEGYKKLGNAEVSGKLKLIRWGDRFRAPVSLTSSQTVGRFRFEESLEYGTIDSVKAFDSHIDFMSVGGALDCDITKGLTLTVGYWHRWTSDENQRGLFLGRLVYDLTDRCRLQYQYKGTRNRDRVPEYYSPEAFGQHALLIGYFDSFFDRLSLRLWVGPIHQDDGTESDLGALENLKVAWRIGGPWLLEGRVEANQVGSGYRYVYSTLSLALDL